MKRKKHETLCSICDKPANPFTLLCEYCDPKSSINSDLKESRSDECEHDGKDLGHVHANEPGLNEFVSYFASNYPGPDTIIHDPYWHAPKIFKACKAAIHLANKQEHGVDDCISELRDQMKKSQLRNDYHTRRRILKLCLAVEGSIR